MNRFLIFVFLLIISCKKDLKTEQNVNTTEELKLHFPQQIDYNSLLQNNSEYIANGFDFPVGKPDAKGYYNAQKFGENLHLGDDWNGVGGGNSDLCDPIYAISNGYVEEAKDYGGGWGNVISIIHLYNDKLYKSMYAHCDTMLVKEKTFIKRGDKIATIGNCNGLYLAHLHLEIRDSLALDIGGGNSDVTDGYLNPTTFIKENRE